jgi:ribosomal protein S18 acetylase RimI-like enzyme
MRAMAVQIQLRPARDEDRDFLRAVYGSTREEELAPTAWTREQKDWFVAQQFHAQDTYYKQHYDGATYDVVFVDGEPAGRLYVARWDDEIRIMDIALLPEFRGQGIGERLLAPLLREGAQAGKTVSIHVEQQNRAMSLYRRLGFVEAGEHGVYKLMRWIAPS